MKKIENFEWNDLVLFSKGWYENDANTEDEFFKCVENVIKLNENRSFEKNMHRDDIMNMMFNVHTQILNHLTDEEKKSPYWCATPKYFYDAVKGWIRRSKMYYNEDISFDYASARVILDIMSDMTKDQIEMKKPVYGKGRLRIGKIDNKDPMSISYKQMNKMATEFFGE